MPGFRDGLLQLLAGSSQQELQDQASLGRGPIQVEPGGGNLDKAVHALASQGITERLGPLVAQALGGGKELAQGVGSVVRGGPFFGPQAYDPEDIEANFAGIDRGRGR